MKVLVTGGAGFVGSHIVEALLEAGHATRVLVRPTTDRLWLRSLGDRIEYATGDVTRPETLPGALAGVDAVVHGAGILFATRRADYFRVNAEGTRALALAADEAGVSRFVYVSSQAAGGPSADGLPVRESDPPRPVSDYGRSKLAGEQALRERGPRFPWVILRPSAVFGSRDQEFLPLFTLASRGWRPAPLGPERRVQIVYVRDVVRAVLAAVTKEGVVGRTYNLADPVPRDWETIGQAAGRALGVPTRRLRFSPSWLYLPALAADLVAAVTGRASLLSRQKLHEAFQLFWVMDCEPAEVELGWRPAASLDEAFRETALWYRAQGWVTRPAPLS